MKTDLLADRHIGIQEEDLPVMLEKIGVKSLDELINKQFRPNPFERTSATGCSHDGTGVCRAYYRTSFTKQDLYLLYRYGLV